MKLCKALTTYRASCQCSMFLISHHSSILTVVFLRSHLLGQQSHFLPLRRFSIPTSLPSLFLFPSVSPSSILCFLIPYLNRVFFVYRSSCTLGTPKNDSERLSNMSYNNHAFLQLSEPRMPDSYTMIVPILTNCCLSVLSLFSLFS